MFLCLVFTGGQLFAQSTESIFREDNNCYKMEVAVLNAIPKYYDRKMYDSIYLVVAYARHFCPGNGVYNMLHNLLMIHYGRPIDSVFQPEDVLVLAKDVRKTKIYRRSNEKLASGEWVSVDLKQRARHYKEQYPHNEWALIGMIQKWASELLPKQKPGSPEELFCNLLTGELGGMMRWVYRKPYQGSPIRKGYAQYHFGEVLHRAVYQEFAAGISLPANASMSRLLGPRPNFSYSIGIRRGYNRYDLFFGSRLGKSTNEPFMVNRPDTVFSSSKAYNFHSGLQYARKISGHNSRWEWNALLGVLFENWDHVPYVDTWDAEDEVIPELEAVERKVKTYSLFGIFPQVGMEAKYFARAGSAVGLSLKYQYMNYFNNRTEMGGSMFLLSLHWSTFTKTN
jgi:hypothetical protein